MKLEQTPDVFESQVNDLVELSAGALEASDIEVVYGADERRCQTLSLLLWEWNFSPYFP